MMCEETGEDRYPRGIEATLRAAVVADGRAVRQIARDAGIDHTALYRWLTGERGLGLPVAEALAAYYRLELRPKR